jgi:plasmid stability protein
LTPKSKIPYWDIVKNITIAIDDETYRRARIKAAERGTSVSALVKQFLTGLAKAADERERLRRAEDLLREEITGFRVGDRLRRDELHNREI